MKNTIFIVITLIVAGSLGVFLAMDNFNGGLGEGTLMKANVQDLVELENEHEHEHDHFAEIEGSAIKQLTIQQIADLWQVDAQGLLENIIQEFNFQETYTIETILEEMRNEYKFSPAVIKDIAEEMRLLEN